MIYPILDTWQALKLIIQQSHAKNYFPDALPLDPVDIIDPNSEYDSTNLQSSLPGVTPGLTTTTHVVICSTNHEN